MVAPNELYDEFVVDCAWAQSVLDDMDHDYYYSFEYLGRDYFNTPQWASLLSCVLWDHLDDTGTLGTRYSQTTLEDVSSL